MTALVALTLLTAAAYQAISEARDAKRFPPPGKLVDIDGRQMHIDCRGTGSPTIIVEQGLGAQPLSWAPVIEQLSAITTTCAYDRAGMGYSEPLDGPTRAVEVARRLGELLRRAGVTDPLVFVAWSAGGVYARQFQRQFPAKVAGMVLVDSTHEQQIQRLGEPEMPSVHPLYWDQYLAPLGWFRLTGQVQRRFENSPHARDIRDRLIALNLQSHLPRTLIAEGEGFRADLLVGRAPASLGDIPLIVLSEGKPDIPFMQERLAVWTGLQRELAGLSTRGRHVVAMQSGHFIHLTEPALIVDAARQVVGEVRNDAAKKLR